MSNEDGGCLYLGGVGGDRRMLLVLVVAAARQTTLVATVLAAIIVAASWIWIVVQSVRAKAKPARSTIYMMGIATAVLLLALFWSRIEPLIIQALKA